MPIVEIRDSVREGARVVVGLSGWTGEGKTMSAILFGYGMANYDPRKLGFLDAENRRGSLMSDVLSRATPSTNIRFRIADLQPPFTPERYSGAIDDFEKAGVEVLIIDSVTHEWEGPGGCIEIAGEDNKKWNAAKKRHKAFVTHMLQSNMHIIVCVRAREKTSWDQVQKEDGAGYKTVISKLGVQPIQEKNFMFEMTASLMMYNKGQNQFVLKCPDDLISVLGRETGYLTPADGKAMRDWVDGAQQLDPTVERFRNRLNSNCEKGKAEIERCWNLTPEAIRQVLGDNFYQTLLKSSEAFDQQRAEEGHASAAGTPAAIAAAAASQPRPTVPSASTPKPPVVATPTPPAASPAKIVLPAAETPAPAPPIETRPEPPTRLVDINAPDPTPAAPAAAAAAPPVPAQTSTLPPGMPPARSVAPADPVF